MAMGKGLKKRFAGFVGRMSEQEVREQLVLAYLQMERCNMVLRGEHVEPVGMLDNGNSSDLELFYTCKKVREELDLLRHEHGKLHDETVWPYVEDKLEVFERLYASAKGAGDLKRGPVVVKVGLDISDVEEKLLMLNDMFDKIRDKFK